MKTKEQIQIRIDKIQKILNIQAEVFNCEPFSKFMYENAITINEQCKLIEEKNILQWVLEDEDIEK